MPKLAIPKKILSAPKGFWLYGNEVCYTKKHPDSPTSLPLYVWLPGYF